MPFSPSDTIVAIATPPGRGGIGVVRLSGPEARAVAQRIITHRGVLEPRHATFTRVLGAGGSEHDEPARPIDEAVVTSFPSPGSYTGEDVVEVSAHGSAVVLGAIVEAAMKAGARLAEPGEFTLRAFLNGRIDLTQAEAVGDLIEAVTPLQARAAFDQLEGTLTRAIAEVETALFELMAQLEASVDFPDEGYHFVERDTLESALDRLSTNIDGLRATARSGRLVREGLQVAIVGRPNVGKSSLFNALAGSARAIVTEVPGTTRDLVTEVVDFEGLRVTLVDTAGLRESDDRVEAEGILRAMQAEAVSDLILAVIDGSSHDDLDNSNQSTENKRLTVINKIDLPSSRPDHHDRSALKVSALTGEGIPELRRRILATAGAEPLRDRPAVTNLRHAALLERAGEAIGRARNAVGMASGPLSEEFVLADLQEALGALEEITGRRAPEELLAHIFSRFCIGK